MSGLVDKACHFTFCYFNDFSIKLARNALGQIRAQRSTCLIIKKVHLRAVDQLRGFSGGEIQPGLGRVHFSEKRGIPYQYIPHMKCDVPRPGDGRSQEFELGSNTLLRREKVYRLRCERETAQARAKALERGRQRPRRRCTLRHTNFSRDTMRKKARIGGDDGQKGANWVLAINAKRVNLPFYEVWRPLR